MPSLLLLTADPLMTEEVSKVSKNSEFRFRSVTSCADAEEWLEMQKFDVFLVDARYSQDEICGLLSLAWIKYPILFGGVLSNKEKLENEAPLRAIGARIFQGKDALLEISEALDALPERVALADKTHFAVLVIEDLDSPRDIICTYIEALGFSKVEGVKSASSALLILRERPIDFFCVITDINMPQMNGVEFIKALRADPLISYLPVLALTSVPTIENVIACLEAGTTGFLAKPLQKKILRKELEKAKRIAHLRESPRLTAPEDHASIELAIRRLGVS